MTTRMNFPINPIVPNAPFLHTLKTTENLKVFRCFQGVKKGCVGSIWVTMYEIIVRFTYH